MGTEMTQGYELWKGTVTVLVANFGRALGALVPMAEQIGIGWREHDAYDDWDKIADVLYWAFVARPIDTSVIPREPFPLAPYDMVIEDLSNNSLLLVRVPGLGNGGDDLVFRRLVTASAPFDTVEAAILEPGGTKASNSTKRYGVSDCEFAARLRFADGTVETVDRITNAL
jgi:hypothetical protein